MRPVCVGAKGAAHSCGHLPFAVVKNLLEIHYCCHHTNLASSDVQCQAGNSPPHRQRVRWRHEGHTQRSPILRLTCRPRPPRDRTCSGLASSSCWFKPCLTQLDLGKSLRCVVWIRGWPSKPSVVRLGIKDSNKTPFGAFIERVNRNEGKTYFIVHLICYLQIL